MKAGDLSRALQMYQNALGLSEHLVKRAGNDSDLQHDLQKAWVRIGVVRSNQNNMTGASEAFRKAVEIAQELTRRDDKNAA